MSTDLTTELTLGLPSRRGLYDPAFEKDGCGVGFICDIKGRASRSIVTDAEHMNCCMVHRGGVGYEKNTGDGAGILTALPHKHLAKIAAQMGMTLPDPGRYGAGVVFLPRDADERARCKSVLERAISDAGQQLIGWRELPVAPDAADIGDAARAAMPHMEHVIIGAADGIEGDELERKLYLIRKSATHQLRTDASLAQRSLFYVCSLSTKVIIYKGMLTPQQLFEFFIDLQDETTSRISRWCIHAFRRTRSRPGTARSPIVS